MISRFQSLESRLVRLAAVIAITELYSILCSNKNIRIYYKIQFFINFYESFYFEKFSSTIFFQYFFSKIFLHNFFSEFVFEIFIFVNFLVIRIAPKNPKSWGTKIPTSTLHKSIRSSWQKVIKSKHISPSTFTFFRQGLRAFYVRT